MSFILDALKKASEQRGVRSTMLLRPAMSRTALRRLNRLPWIVVGILLLLNVAGAIYLLRPVEVVAPPPPPVLPKVALIQPIEPLPSPTHVIPADPPKPIAPVKPAAPPSSRAPAARNGAAASPAAPAPLPTPAVPGVGAGRAPSGTPLPPQSVDRPVVRAAPDARVSITRPDPAPPTVAAPPGGAAKPGAAAAAPGGAARPGARFKLEVLSYSDIPAQRLVFINGRRYREGEMLDGSVKVEEIREDSVILSDAGQRFTLR